METENQGSIWLSQVHLAKTAIKTVCIIDSVILFYMNSQIDTDGFCETGLFFHSHKSDQDLQSSFQKHIRELPEQNCSSQMLFWTAKQQFSYIDVIHWSVTAHNYIGLTLTDHSYADLLDMGCGQSESHLAVTKNNTTGQSLSCRIPGSRSKAWLSK